MHDLPAAAHIPDPGDQGLIPAHTWIDDSRCAQFERQPPCNRYEENLKAIEDVLMKKHGFQITPGDLEGIRWAFSNNTSSDLLSVTAPASPQTFHPPSSERGRATATETTE